MIWRWWYDDEGVCLDDPETRSLMDRETWGAARVGDEGIEPADIWLLVSEARKLSFVLRSWYGWGVFALVDQPKGWRW